MPRKRTAPYWEDRVKALYEGDGRERPPSAREIASILESEVGGADAPAQRTIEKILARHKKLPEEERAPYRLFSWPASMMHGLLPWPASACLLELLGLYHSEFGAPSIRFARSFWWVTQAAPDLDIRSDEEWQGRCSVARQVAIFDALGRSPINREMQTAELYLAHAPWRSSDNAKRYRAAGKRGMPMFTGSRVQMTETEAASFLTSCFYGAEISPLWLARRHQ